MSCKGPFRLHATVGADARSHGQLVAHLKGINFSDGPLIEALIGLEAAQTT